MLQKLKTSFIQGNRAQWIVFSVFALTIFVKCLLFHWFAFHSMLVSSLWKNPLAFFNFYCPKLTIAIFIASFVLISKRCYWTVVVSVLIDIWMTANVLYFNANGLFIDFPAITLIGQLSGFASSILVYWEPILTCTYIVTICYLISLVLIFPRSNQLSIKCFFIILAISITNYIYCQYKNYYKLIPHDSKSIIFYKNNGGAQTGEDYYKMYGRYKQKCFIPYHQVAIRGLEGTWTTIPKYIECHSIITYFPCLFFDYFHSVSQKEISCEYNINNLNEELSLFLNKKQNNVESPKQNLLIILVESLESWAITSIEGIEIMPNIMKLLKTTNTLFSPNITSQVKHGVSGDGQMIVNTGLLPISQGSAAAKYGNNVFPNIAHFYQNSCVVAPSRTWNQPVVTYSYGYQKLIMPSLVESQPKEWQDEKLCTYCNEIIEKMPEPFCIQLLTVSSHTPFDRVEHEIPLPTDLPKYMKDYLCMLNYADSCIGNTISKLQELDLLKNTTIVITGDHTIFQQKLLEDFKPAANKYGLIFQDKTFCPLVIHSTQIFDNVLLTDTCYQMDIFPTILHLIGCEDYYWKGVGVNLLDSVARNNRVITEHEAFILSDKVIRANWFETISDTLRVLDGYITGS